MKLLYIEWSDTANDGGDWIDFKRAVREVEHCQSVGWILEEDDEKLVIVPNISEDKQCFGSVIIPKGCITKRKVLKI